MHCVSTTKRLKGRLALGRHLSGLCRGARSALSMASARSPRRDDPSRATRAELATRAAESVTALGGFARLVAKAASSPALHSTVGAFMEYEGTIESTDEMLRKVHQGLVDLDEAVDDCARSARALAVQQQQQQQQHQ